MPTNHPHLPEPTALLEYSHSSLETFIEARNWRLLAEWECIGAIYTYVRDEIGFGYNLADDLPASQVLADAIGQCNTKETLLMALLRCGANLSGIKRWLFKNIVRHWMNQNVARIRCGGKPSSRLDSA